MATVGGPVPGIATTNSTGGVGPIASQTAIIAGTTTVATQPPIDDTLPTNIPSDQDPINTIQTSLSPAIPTIPPPPPLQSQTQLTIPVNTAIPTSSQLKSVETTIDPALQTGLSNSSESVADSLALIKLPAMIGGGLLAIALIVIGIVVYMRTSEASKTYRRRRANDGLSRLASMKGRDAGKGIGRKRSSLFDEGMIAASQGANSRKGSAVSGASSTVNTNPRHPRHPHHHRNDDTTPLMRSQSPYSTVSSNSRRPSNHSDATYHLQGGSRRPSAATTVSNPSNPRPSTSETSSLLNAYAQIHHQPHQPQQPWSNQHQDTSQWSNRGTYPSLSELGYPTQPYPSIPQRDTSSRTSSSSSASSASAKTPPRPKPQMGRIASLAPTIASTDIGDDDTRSTIKSRHHGRATPPTGRVIPPRMTPGAKAAPAFIPPPIPEQGREWKPPPGSNRTTSRANGTGKASAAALMAKNARMRHMSLMTDGGKSLAPSTVYDEDD